jgi:hypothetical protein
VTPHLRSRHGARLAKNPFYNLETFGMFGFRARFPLRRSRVPAADNPSSPPAARCQKKDKLLKLKDFRPGFEVGLAARAPLFVGNIVEGEHG